jgi:hypothetical protein
MGKLLIIASLVLSVGVVGTASAATKMSFGACKTMVIRMGETWTAGVETTAAVAAW